MSLARPPENCNDRPDCVPLRSDSPVDDLDTDSCPSSSCLVDMLNRKKKSPNSKLQAKNSAASTTVLQGQAKKRRKSSGLEKIRRIGGVDREGKYLSRRRSDVLGTRGAVYFQIGVGSSLSAASTAGGGGPRGSDSEEDKILSDGIGERRDCQRNLGYESSDGRLDVDKGAGSGLDLALTCKTDKDVSV